MRYIEGSAFAEVECLRRPAVGPIDGRGETIGARIHDRDRALEEFAVGTGFVGARLDHRGDVAHRHLEVGLGGFVLVGDADAHAIDAVVGPGVAELEGLARDGLGAGNDAVVPVDLDCPLGAVGVFEAERKRGRCPFGDLEILRQREHGCFIGHGDVELRLAGAAVVVFGRDPDRVHAGDRPRMRQRHLAAVGECMDFGLALVAPIDGRGDVVGARIGDAHRPLEFASVGELRVVARIDGRRDVGHFDRDLARALLVGVSDGDRHGKRAVVDVGMGEWNRCTGGAIEGLELAAVSPIDRERPRVAVGVLEGERPLVGRALVDLGRAGQCESGRHVDHGHREARLAFAAVVVGDAHHDLVDARLGPNVGDGLGRIEGLGLAAVGPIDLAAERVGAGIGDVDHALEALGVGDLGVTAGVDHGRDVAHLDGEVADDRIGAVADLDLDLDDRVIGPGISEREGLVGREREGSGAGPVVDRRRPGVGVGVGEAREPFEPGPLIDHHRRAEREHRRPIGDGDEHRRFARAAVVVGHRDRDRIHTPTRPAALDPKTRAVERQRLGSVAVVDDRLVRVGAGIVEGAVAAEHRAAGDGGVGAELDDGRDVGHRHVERGGIDEQAIGNLHRHRVDAVVVGGELDLRTFAIVEDTVVVEIPGHHERVAIGIDRSARVEGQHRAFRAVVGPDEIGDRRQIGHHAHAREVGQRDHRLAVDVDYATERVERAGVGHAQRDLIGPRPLEEPLRHRIVGDEVDVLEELAVVVQIPLVDDHAIGGIDIERVGGVEANGQPRRRVVGTAGVREWRVRRLGGDHPPRVDVGLGRKTVVGDPQPHHVGLGHVAVSLRIRIQIGIDGPRIVGIVGDEIEATVAVEVPLVQHQLPRGIAVEAMTGAELERGVVGPNDIVAGVGHRWQHEEGRRQHDRAPRRLQVAIALGAHRPRAPVGARAHLSVDEPSPHPDLGIVVPIEAGEAQPGDRRGKSEPQRFDQGEQRVGEVALPQPSPSDLVLGRAPPGIGGRYVVESELDHARGRRGLGIARPRVAVAHPVVGLCEPDHVLGFDEVGHVDAEGVFGRVHADGGPLAGAVVGSAVPGVPPAAARAARVDLTPGVGVDHVGHQFAIGPQADALIAGAGEAEGSPRRGQRVHDLTELVDGLGALGMHGEAVAVGVGIAGRLDGGHEGSQRDEERVEAGAYRLDVRILAGVAFFDVPVDQESLQRRGGGGGDVAGGLRPVAGGAHLVLVQPPQRFVDRDIGTGIDVVGADLDGIAVLAELAVGVPDTQCGGVGRTGSRRRVGVRRLDLVGIRDCGRHRGLRRRAIAEVPLIGERAGVACDGFQPRGPTVDHHVPRQRIAG